MRLYFDNTDIARRLARVLHNQAASYGLTLRLSRSLEVVAQCFGYANHNELVKMLGLAEPSLPDRLVSEEHRGARFKQYVEVLTRNGLSPHDASDFLSKMRVGNWWGFGT